jgi:hypothetical protein
VSIETELTTTDNVNSEAARLYKTLQSAVDREMQSTGFVPGTEYGAEVHPVVEQSSSRRTPVSGPAQSHSRPWKASDKQKELVQKLVENTGIEIEVVEALSEEMFGFPDLPDLNKIQMSGLIDELLARYGKRQKRDAAPNGRFNGRSTR